MKIYVANIRHDATDEDLFRFFSQVGRVKYFKRPKNIRTNEPRGFAFVTYSNDDETAAAMIALHGADFHGRLLVCQEAREFHGGHGA